jgi:hypothetical protein
MSESSAAIQRLARVRKNSRWRALVLFFLSMNATCQRARPYLPSFTPASAAQEQALIAKKPVPGVKFVPGTEAAPVRACVLRGGQRGPAPRPQLHGRATPPLLAPCRARQPPDRAARVDDAH